MIKNIMAIKTKPQSAHSRITLGLPDIQNQLRVIDQLTRTAEGSDREHLEELGRLLSEFYSQFQHQKQITIYRFSSRSRSKSDN